MSNRELVIEVASKLPEDTPIEEIVRQIAFVAGVNEAVDQSNLGQHVSAEEARDLLKQWTTEST